MRRSGFMVFCVSTVLGVASVAAATVACDAFKSTGVLRVGSLTVDSATAQPVANAQASFYLEADSNAADTTAVFHGYDPATGATRVIRLRRVP